MASDDDTPGPEEFDAEQAKTILTAIPLDAVVEAPIEDVTKPHDLAPVLEEARLRGRDEGCRACYEEGQEDALTALRSLLYEKDTPEDEVLAVVAAVRARLVKL